MLGYQAIRKDGLESLMRVKYVFSSTQLEERMDSHEEEAGDETRTRDIYLGKVANSFDLKTRHLISVSPPASVEKSERKRTVLHYCAGSRTGTSGYVNCQVHSRSNYRLPVSERRLL